MEELFDDLVVAQKKRLLELARLILPNLTADDIMQPNDFPELEGHPEFRYEEGVLEGILTARMAFLAKRKELGLTY
jgi:hypothetical protein